eukprot:1161099-Pelagomonas_calceolata.AAC.7
MDASTLLQKIHYPDRGTHGSSEPMRLLLLNGRKHETDTIEMESMIGLCTASTLQRPLTLTAKEMMMALLRASHSMQCGLQSQQLF